MGLLVALFLFGVALNGDVSSEEKNAGKTYHITYEGGSSSLFNLSTWFYYSSQHLAAAVVAFILFQIAVKAGTQGQENRWAALKIKNATKAFGYRKRHVGDTGGGSSGVFRVAQQGFVTAFICICWLEDE